MIRRLTLALIMGTALGAAMPVRAVTCYEVIDRNNTVVFRDSYTPVDLSDAGAPLRDAMYRRGELLIIFDANTCLAVGGGVTSASKKATVEEIVAEWRSNWGASSYSNWSPSYRQ